MTPDDALWQWQKSHQRLSPKHRASFKTKIELSGLLDYDDWIIRSAIAENQKIDDAVAAAARMLADAPEQAQQREHRRRMATPRPTATRAPSGSDRRPPKAKGRKSGPKPRGRAMENTDPYRSASGSGMVRDWGRRMDYDPGPKRFCPSCGALEVACKCR